MTVLYQEFGWLTCSQSTRRVGPYLGLPWFQPTMKRSVRLECYVLFNTPSQGRLVNGTRRASRLNQIFGVPRENNSTTPFGEKRPCILKVVDGIGSAWWEMWTMHNPVSFNSLENSTSLFRGFYRFGWPKNTPHECHGSRDVLLVERKIYVRSFPLSLPD